MTGYVHHVPGRLRVRSTVVKRNEAEADRVKRRLHRLDGVLGTNISMVTGSIVVHYDPARLEAEALLNSLYELGYLQDPAVVERSSSVPRADGDAFKDVGSIVATKVFETVLERTALALVAALI